MHSYRNIIFLIVLIALIVAPGAAFVARYLPFEYLRELTSFNLFGQTISAETPRFTIGQILSTKTQSDLSSWLAERMGRPRELYIRLSNSLDYLIGRSSNPQIVVGENGELFTREMIADFCLKVDTDFAVEMAKGLKRSQDVITRRGKAFVFVISPNKAAIAPANVPYYCQQRRSYRGYRRLTAALREAGVSFIDTEALSAQSVSDGMPAWFGKYGQHWNDIGLFYVTRAIADNLRAQLNTTIGTFQKDNISFDDKPVGNEADTGLLSNFLFPLRPESPHLKISLSGGHKPLRLLMVGTSFSDGLIGVFLRTHFVEKIVLYNYFKRILLYDPITIIGVGKPDDVSQDYLSTLDNVDAVVVEVNASALNAPHVFRFIEATDRLP